MSAPAKVKDEIYDRTAAGEVIIIAEVKAREAAHKAKGKAKAAADTQARVVVSRNSEQAKRTVEAAPADPSEVLSRARAQAEKVLENSRGLEQVLSGCSDLSGLIAARSESQILQVRACPKALSRLQAALPPA